MRRRKQEYSDSHLSSAFLLLVLRRLHLMNGPDIEASISQLSAGTYFPVRLICTNSSYFIGVNISERKSGTERPKKRKKRELVCFPTARGATDTVVP